MITTKKPVQNFMKTFWVVIKKRETNPKVGDFFHVATVRAHLRPRTTVQKFMRKYWVVLKKVRNKKSTKYTKLGKNIANIPILTFWVCVCGQCQEDPYKVSEKIILLFLINNETQNQTSNRTQKPQANLTDLLDWSSENKRSRPCKVVLIPFQKVNVDYEHTRLNCFLSLYC